VLCQLQSLSIIDRTLYGEWLGKPGDNFTQLVNLSQIVISVTIFVRGARYWTQVLALLFSVFLLSSTAWSVDGGATLRAAIQYLFLVIGLIGVAEQFDGDQFMRLLSWLCFLSAIASFVLLVVAPASALSELGDFRGLFSQKNVLGQAMAVGALACLHGRWAQTSGWTRFILFFSVIAAAAVKSESATSCLAIVLYCALGTGIQLLQRGGASRIVGVTGLTLFIGVLLVASVDSGAFFEIIGKDPTLTHRTDIWAYIVPYMSERPVLGWGYAAFWSTQNPAAWAIADALHWYAPQAHNGALEILLSVGVVGLSFVIYVLGRAIWLSLRAMRTLESAMGITCFLSCAGILLVGISEEVLLYPGGFTLVFFATALFCEQTISRARQRRPELQRGVGRLAIAHQIYPCLGE
jgi:exopolysaccharide production protein ExoQ